MHAPLLPRREFFTSDLTERRFRKERLAAFDAAQLSDDPDVKLRFYAADRALTDYIWNRAKADIEADRRKHPKAKRNQPPPPNSTPSGGRCLP